ncbi:SDR family oxidoreductase [Mucilaginibacter lappiensis]|uniref:NAD(P)-dependent dehydrogenase (Short-subunit alcohol dehydrogenase family) n=1 Tax=Mucilaginibacter lappiensis TaxID=354630 RepID=A0A841J4S8_9SPHI|nr:SDR family oxidoreductase [Mucilaginibacter lappiensis]MBB6126209.1 NAD(P)-dependent dehydrogenase (short-subunit alcohol dehydrogenase family) [Mucilaginibacter lappiensis]
MKKTILITGASSGIGREAAKLFQHNGWNVIATMRSPEKELELNQLDDVLVTRLDVQDQSSISGAIEEGIARFGRIDTLVNNAGYALVGVFESASHEQIHKQFNVNFFGLIDVTQAMLPYMRSQGSGTIINISSMGGQITFPFGSLYHSTKFAVEGLSESLAHELYSLGITVKVVEPGSIATNFRGAVDMVKNDIAAYDPIFAGFFNNYAQAASHLTKATPEEVAQIIYDAATDGTDRLRYAVGADAHFFIDTKYQNSDPDYMRQMRGYFIK